MILNLRQRHRLIFSGLVLVLPVAFAASILFRAAPLPKNTVPLLQRDAAASLSRYIFEKQDLWPGANIVTRVFADSLPPALLAVELQPAATWSLPEVLVYWQAGPPGNEAQALRDAFLLGTLVEGPARRWLLPLQAAHTDGHLILFSLAHQNIVAQASLPINHLLQQGGRR
jgi:hypothetical protein